MTTFCFLRPCVLSLVERRCARFLEFPPGFFRILLAITGSIDLDEVLPGVLNTHFR